jgi:hypothetical protein
LPSKPEYEVSQADVEEWIIDGDKGIEVSHTVTDDDLINAVMNSNSENKNLEGKSSDEIGTEKVFWAKVAIVYSTLLKFAEGHSWYSAQEVMQLHILHSSFLQE